MSGENLSGAIWRKSSQSQPNGSCVELASDGQNWRIRDSKQPEAGVLVVACDPFRALLDLVKGVQP